MRAQSTPLVRVSLEPKNTAELPLLKRGLRLLNQADPCVELVVTQNGELHLLALGELHLERCVKELAERFAQVEIHVRFCCFLCTASTTQSLIIIDCCCCCHLGNTIHRYRNPLSRLWKPFRRQHSHSLSKLVLAPMQRQQVLMQAVMVVLLLLLLLLLPWPLPWTQTSLWTTWSAASSLILSKRT